MILSNGKKYMLSQEITTKNVQKIIFGPTPYVTISIHSKMWFLGSYLPTFLPDVTLFTLFFFEGFPKTSVKRGRIFGPGYLSDKTLMIIFYHHTI